MNETPIFNSPAQAIETLFSIVVRLSRLVVWTLIALAHLALVVIALAACWFLGVTAADVVAAYLRVRQSMPVEVLSFVGVSAGTVVVVRLWAMRRVQKAVAGTWLSAYLMKGL